MKEIPRSGKLDSTLALARDPYRMITKTCASLRTDMFQTRFLMQPTVCMTGVEAAELFYTPGNFYRSGAVPGRIIKTLFGRGGVQGLDDARHRHRKAMFMSMLAGKEMDRLVRVADRIWRQFVSRWERQPEIVLYEQSQELLLRAACEWSGVPLGESDISRRTKQVAYLFDGAGAVGPRHWAARFARKLANRWMEQVVNDIRSGELRPNENTAAFLIADFRDVDGKMLSARVAAVELLNIIRPIVAISVYITFAALALHQYPENRRRLQDETGSYTSWFVQEIRRFYPFFPAVGARVRESFEWHDYRFPKDQLVLLDLFGTNHDARVWDAPDIFDPQRFASHAVSPFNLIPQGGGDHSVNHRCAGEWITLAILERAVKYLSGCIDYEVPMQDLKVTMSRLPAIPKSHFRIKDVRQTGDLASTH